MTKTHQTQGFVSIRGCARSIGFTSKRLPMGEQSWDEDDDRAPTFCFPVSEGQGLEEALVAAGPPRMFL